MRRAFFYGRGVVAVTTMVAAGWIAIVAGFTALAIRREGPDAKVPAPASAAA